MKKITSIVLCICLIMTLLCGCSKQNATESNFSDDVIVEEIIIDNTSSGSDESSVNTETSDVPSGHNTSADNSSADNQSQNTSSKVDPASCSHSYDGGKIEKTAELFKAGTKKYTCTKCGDSYIGTYPVEKLKLLAIGNSFSLNSMWELYSLCNQAGVKEIDIAIMYIGGCSLDAHWENVQNNSATYELYRNTDGVWETTKNYSIETIINEGGWDIITLQNKSEHAAEQDKFSNLDNMVNYVSAKCPDATLLWNMTWAFTKDSVYLNEKYQRDDTKMFKNITECAQNIVAKNQKIHTIVPVGTAVMNARTSSIKNDVHQDDGSHLSEDIGYYVGAFTWFGAITGMPLYDVNLFSLNPTVSQNIDIIRESAQNALENPYEITQSYYAN